MQLPGKELNEVESASPQTERRRRTLVGGCLGNAVEWYDFAIFGAFSTILARTFFPAGDRRHLRLPLRSSRHRSSPGWSVPRSSAGARITSAGARP